MRAAYDYFTADGCGKQGHIGLRLEASVPEITLTAILAK